MKVLKFLQKNYWQIAFFILWIVACILIHISEDKNIALQNKINELEFERDYILFSTNESMNN